MMLPSNKLNKQVYAGVKDAVDESDTPSNNLWIGNVTSDITEADLMQVFADFGVLDVTCYASRSYAFLFFKCVEDAMAAKIALQGTLLKGNPLKIEFARPAKPSKYLWVGGISPKVSKEELEEEFVKFGKIEDFKFLRDRNTAFVEFLRVEDASLAMRNLNGKQIGSEQIRVDFLRSQPSGRDPRHYVRDTRDPQFLARNMGLPDTYLSSKRQEHFQSLGGRKGDGQPTNVLWIGYPPSVQIDEQMLHNAMILFGEIERIKSFPSRHYSFVEFRSVDEARRAKEGLQGRLFNDPRITIMFSSSGLAPGKEYSGSYPGSKGPMPELFFNENPFGSAQMDMFGHNRPLVPTNGSLPPGGILGHAPMRPFGPPGGFESGLPGPEYKDLPGPHNLQDGNPNNLMGLNWRRPSPPAPGLLSSPALGSRTASGGWDVFETNQFQRDSKRSRADAGLSIDDDTFPVKKINDRALGLNQSYGLGPVNVLGASGPYPNMQGKNRFSSVGAKGLGGGRGQVNMDNDFVWRGTIAKGGTPVCHARCVPIGEGIGSDIPEVVNCSARTGLDMLTKHYAEASGFDIVFFLPDSEDDFAPYTEFLRYLGANNRAGVAKFDDGTTLFLVPPSDFLTKVLDIQGPERLYGVVLKFQQQLLGSASMQSAQQPIPSSQYLDRHQIPPHYNSVVPPMEKQVFPNNNNRFLHENSNLSQKPFLPPISEPVSVQSVPQGYTSNSTGTVSQTGVTLTPELIASLASLLPANTQSSASESAQPALGSSTIRPHFPSSATSDNGIPAQGWKQDHQPSEHGPLSQQLESPFTSRGLPSQFQAYPSFSNTPSHSTNTVLSSMHNPDPAVYMPSQGSIGVRPPTSFVTASQSGQSAVSPQVSQQYHPEAPHNTQEGYAVVHGSEAPGLYGAPAFQQNYNPVSASHPSHGVNVAQLLTGKPTVDKVNVELPNQVLPLPSTAGGVGQVTSDGEVDKNQRYQSTLQFAANLLLQIQQQQQNNPAGRGTGNQQ